MKKVVFILLSLIFMTIPSTILAADCASVGGHCTVLKCANGNALAGDCTFPQQCCPNAPTNAGGQSGAGNDTSGGVSGQIFCGGGDTEIYTAIGCIPVLGDTTGAGFMGFALKWAVGIGGGIAFIFIVYAGFLMMTSSGNPERLKAGQELLNSAIMGLILLVLSVFILNLIGVKILAIPGFS